MTDINTTSAKRVFDFFEEIAAIPHTSGNTSPIAEYLVAFAKARGLEYIRDSYDNVIIKKAATKGYENRETVILQGHTDMVCAVETGRDIDMTKDGVKVIRDGDFLTADGTTLGADDGIFMAYALAILDSNDISHPAIEALFTSDEETGLIGATELDGSLLTGRKMINIDSDLEGIFTVGCAGGLRTDVTLPYTHSEVGDGLFQVTVSGLRGGHSGMEIDKGRENAIKILGEVICGSLISKIEGGNADNAIPRSASAIIKPSSYSCLCETIKLALNKHSNAEGGIKIEAQAFAGALPLYSKADSEKILDFITKMPTGVYKMSEDIKDLPETSSNLGIISSEGGRVTLSTSIRSSKNAKKLALCDMITALAVDFSATVNVHSAYPAWEYRKSSPLRDSMAKVYESLYGKAPTILVIHAGLECGIFSD